MKILCIILVTLAELTALLFTTYWLFKLIEHYTGIKPLTVWPF